MKITDLKYALSSGVAVALLSSIGLAACGGGGSSQEDPETRADSNGGEQARLLKTANSSGVLATYTASGTIDESNPFFKPLGNGRSCASCHQAADAWSLTPQSVQARFSQTDGTDALFQAHDAANSPLADVSTVEARRAAYSMLLNKAVIRMSLPIPDDAEFELAATDDPYGYANSAGLSLFRRPLPAANLKFLASVMWDGRETYKDPSSTSCFAGTNDCYSTLEFNLSHQARNAVTTHAQAAQELTAEEQAAIVGFEKGLFTAQLVDNDAGDLTGIGGKGGPFALAGTAFYFGINDQQAGDYRSKVPFNPNAITLFDAWNTTSSLSDAAVPASNAATVTAARRSIARGQSIFNNREMLINNVSGMPGTSVRGTCTTCHNAPNTGGSSTPLLMNIGTAAASERTPDMPLYTLRNKATGETIQTMDPGAALSSGKWEDIGRVKVPVLRALAARAPYFHNGSAKDLREVVVFYNTRFQMHLSTQEIIDLSAFLKAL
ncbi:cytochrome C [Oxalobacteraceae bacterium R-40]|uniref:Cytochrome C n=1 Tax=Keguizhuia sedimenti TaxID=3064264 RepID=A0ABU1BL10_9BURK|nr:cytochrome C [Oxalobacteraceae bacterium R-40]